MNVETLLQLILMLAPLSLVAVGGVNTVLPEIHRQVVHGYGWLTDGEFAALFAIAQAAPGPNIALLVSLIGWQVAGGMGIVVALLAMSLPSAVLAYTMARVWQRFRDARWRRPVQAGLAHIAIGLVLSSGAVLTTAADTTIAAYAVTAATTILVLRTSLHPLLLMAGAAVLAIAGWI